MIPTSFAAVKTTRISEQTIRGVFKETAGHVRSRLKGKRKTSGTASQARDNTRTFHCGYRIIVGDV